MLRTRVLSALVLASAGISAILYLPVSGFALLAAMVLGLGAWEWTQLVPLRALAARIGLTAAICALFYLAWIYVPRSHIPDFALAGAGFWLLCLAWLANPKAGSSGSLATRVAKVAAAIAALVPAWLSLVWLRGQDSGAWWVLGLLVVVWAADILAYFTGKQFGKHKLAPSVSPGKTWEGVGGALLGAGIYGALVCTALKPEWNWLQAAALTIVIAALSVVGDLLISLLKRQAEVKDSGVLIPGHGGVLDRFDSTLAAAPVSVAGISLLWI